MSKRKEKHIYCPYCGTENPHGVQSCRKCGKRLGQYRARHIYLVGTLIWIAIWLGVFIPPFGVGVSMFASSQYWWLSLIPFFMCIGGMLCNAKIWWEERSFGDYPTEVNIIEIVEGHVRPLVLAISVVLLIATGLKVMPPAFIWYEISALICACCGILPLYWIPCDMVEDLVRLRHWKTIPYFYSIFFFLAGLLSLLTAIVP